MEVIKHLLTECNFLIHCISCKTLNCELPNGLKLSKLKISIVRSISSKSSKHSIKIDNVGEDVGRKGLSISTAIMKTSLEAPHDLTIYFRDYVSKTQSQFSVEILDCSHCFTIHKSQDMEPA